MAGGIVDCVNLKTIRLGAGIRYSTITCNRKCKYMHASRISVSSVMDKMIVRRASCSGLLGGKASGHRGYRFKMHCVKKNMEEIFDDSTADALVSQSRTAEVVRLWLLLLFLLSAVHWGE